MELHLELSDGARDGMADALEKTTHDADGTVTVATLEMSPEMERIYGEIAAFDSANPNFWCRCGESETGRIEPRGHSVDVFCKNCGGCVQVG